MKINCAFIGFGKGAKRYHLPYVLARRDQFSVHTIYDTIKRPSEEAQAAWQGIHFTDNVQNILQNPEITLVTLCTPPSTHFEYAKRCLEHGKNVTDAS